MNVALNAAVQRAMREKMAADEIKIRNLLGKWVSELEPSIVYHNNEIIGLCDAKTEIGMKPFILKS